MNSQALSYVIVAILLGSTQGYADWQVSLVPGFGWALWVFCAAMIAWSLFRPQAAKRKAALSPRGIGVYIAVILGLLVLTVPPFYGYDLHWMWRIGPVLYAMVGILSNEFAPKANWWRWVRLSMLVFWALGTLLWVSPCTLIACEPQPWASQKATLAEQIAARMPKATIYGMAATPSRATIYWFSAQPQWNLDVFVVDNLGSSANPDYRSTTFRYDDYNVSGTLSKLVRRGALNQAPPTDPPDPRDLAAWQRTQVGPREALAATEARGREFLGRAAAFREVMVTLSLNSSMAELAAHPSVWLVSYRDTQRDGAILEIWVDAERGTLIGERVF